MSKITSLPKTKIYPGMEKIISFILAASLVVAVCLLTTKKTFSQTLKENKSDTTTVTTKPDGGSPGTYVKGITAMRARSLVGVALGLASLIVGWRARKHAAARIGNRGRNVAIVAVLLGAIAFVISIIHLNITAGAVFGSGSGKAGGIFALLLNLIGMTLGGLSLRQKKV
jgi:5,10-methenyltetrahydromethanopterin hydrogenase